MTSSTGDVIYPFRQAARPVKCRIASGRAGELSLNCSATSVVKLYLFALRHRQIATDHPQLPLNQISALTTKKTTVLLVHCSGQLFTHASARYRHHRN